MGWRGIFPAAASSLMIEVMQLVTRRGLCELDDVLHNTLGAAIGIAVITVLEAWRDIFLPEI